LAKDQSVWSPSNIETLVTGHTRFRDGEAERVGGLQVDDQFELGRLHDRQVGRLGAIKNFAGIGADLTETVLDIGSVAHQPAGYDMITVRISRRNPAARRQGGNLHAAAGEECVGRDEEGIGALAREGGKDRIDLGVTARTLWAPLAISALGVNCASRDPERRLGLRALRAAAHSHSGG
jgi:hypothetical protein